MMDDSRYASSATAVLRLCRQQIEYMGPRQRQADSRSCGRCTIASHVYWTADQKYRHEGGQLLRRIQLQRVQTCSS